MRGYTVEMSFLMPVILLLIMSSMYAFFYYHDKNIISGAAYETAVVGSMKVREQAGADEDVCGEMETLFQNRVNGKCILLTSIQSCVGVSEDEIYVQAQAAWKKMRLTVEKRAAVTEPEQKLREIGKIKGLVDGTKNHN